ncbi:MAG: response regulator [Melioribacteraceae bacterium]|nr:response regulator [Melioribacteraceae bacterium]MCF8354017.1 response regulator [Melioribacteraceae bacterium]MCF8392302.1 response regulator [Melioribacteraceae bacterium]MCF8417634.1 response regulator [Melioribacteraceae bacterium]
MAGSTSKVFISEEKKKELVKEEITDQLIVPLRLLAVFTAVAGIFALIFEVRHFADFSIQIYYSRLLSTGISFLVLVLSYTNTGKKHPVILVHLLLLFITYSTATIIYLLPKTLVVNSNILALVIFTSAIFLSWEVKNQIIVAIYYNVVFASSFLLNSDTRIYFIPNMFESVLFVMILSIMAIAASTITSRFRIKSIVKNLETMALEERFRHIFEESAEGIFQTNIAGKFLLFNPALVRILGYESDDEFKKLNAEKDIYENPKDRKEIIEQLEKQGEVKNKRLKFKKKDGNSFYVRLNARMIEDGYSAKYIEGFIEDITLQVKFEEEQKRTLQQTQIAKLKSDELAQQVQNISDQKSKFIASMSHEIRNPMNSILGFLALIEDEAYDDKLELTNFANNAKVAAESLLDLLNGVLDISKIEAGKMELDEVDFSIRDEIKKAYSILLSSAQGKGLNLKFKVEDDVPDILIGDNLRFRQILINLLTNAIKFTKIGEVITYVKTREKVGSKIVIVCTVKDTGVGIPKEKVNQLFKPYSQVTTDKVIRKKGTGLGLVIVRELVTLMGGNIAVKSEPDKGSIFQFTITLGLTSGKEETGSKKTDDEEIKELETFEDEQSQISAKKIPKSHRSDKKILLVEDNPISQKVEHRLLSEVGYNVEAVSSGKEALTFIEKKDFSLILMDLEMPGMDGLETTRRIRSLDHIKSKIPIIAVTAHSSMKDRERCLTSGMDDYISKPINIHYLKITIDSWLKESENRLNGDS